ncbi:MAG: hypothetical protein ACOYUZ_04160 [Patescibacteria group bacterium]
MQILCAVFVALIAVPSWAQTLKDGYWHVRRGQQVDRRQCRKVEALQAAVNTWLYKCQMPGSDRWQVIHGRKAYDPAVSVWNLSFKEGKVMFRWVDVYGRTWDQENDKNAAYVEPVGGYLSLPAYRPPFSFDDQCGWGGCSRTTTRTMPVRNACGKQVRDYILANDEPLVAIYLGAGKYQVCHAQEDLGTYDDVKNLTFYQGHVRFAAKTTLNGWYLVQDKTVISRPFTVQSLPVDYFDEIDGVIYSGGKALARGQKYGEYYLLEDAKASGPYDEMTAPIDAGNGVALYATLNKRPAK